MDFFGFDFDDVKLKPNVDDFGFRFDADEYNNETEKFQQEIKTLKPAFDELVAIAGIDDFDFRLDPLDSLISEKRFDAEEDDIAVKSLDELLDEMLSTDDDECRDVHEDEKEEEEDESTMATPVRATRSTNGSGQNVPNKPIKKRSNQQIKESALFQPLEHLYSHK
jgi:hypothetical protein